jgi:hypothetical protein
VKMAIQTRYHSEGPFVPQGMMLDRAFDGANDAAFRRNRYHESLTVFWTSIWHGTVWVRHTVELIVLALPRLKKSTFASQSRTPNPLSHWMLTLFSGSLGSDRNYMV